MKKRRVAFKVSFLLPEDASVALAQEYVEAAVSSWCGSLEPPHEDGDGEWSDGNPMFNLSGKIKVTRITRTSRT